MKKFRRQVVAPNLQLTGASGSGIGTAEIDDLAVTAAKLGASAVETAKINDLAVTTGKIANDAVTDAKLGPTALKTQKYQYDFADLGGAAGAITLTDDADAAQQIPDNAVIVNAWVENLTAASEASGSPTIALGYTANTDAFLGATAFDNAAFSGVAVTAAANDLPLKTTAAVSVLATIADANLDAGKFNLWIQYYEGD